MLTPAKRFAGLRVGRQAGEFKVIARRWHQKTRVKAIVGSRSMLIYWPRPDIDRTLGGGDSEHSAAAHIMILAMTPRQSCPAHR